MSVGALKVMAARQQKARKELKQLTSRDSQLQVRFTPLACRTGGRASLAVVLCCLAWSCSPSAPEPRHTCCTAAVATPSVPSATVVILAFPGAAVAILHTPYLSIRSQAYHEMLLVIIQILEEERMYLKKKM